MEDDSCTFAIMNFINAVSDYETEHGAALEGLKITTERFCYPYRIAGEDLIVLRCTSEFNAT